MNESKTLFKNFSSSFIGTVIGNIFAFGLLIYLPNIIGVKNYGIYNFAISYNMYFLILTDLGISIYSIKYINNNKVINKYVNKIFSLKLFLGILSFILSAIILKLSNVSNEKFIFTTIINISIIATSISIDYLFNALNEMKYSALYTSSKNVIMFILTIIFVRNMEHMYSVAIIYTISLFISAFILLYIFNKIHFKIKLRRVELEDFAIIKNTIPLAISLIMIQLNNNFDILYLSFLKGDTDVGIYSAAYKIINFLIALLVVYFNSAYPTISQLYNEDKYRLGDYLKKFFDYGLIIVLPITVGGIMLGDNIVSFLYGSNYENSGTVLKLLVVLIIIRFIASTYGAVLLMGNEAKKYTMVVIIGAIINILFNCLLAPKFSYNGCAIATLISEFIQIILFYYYCNKEVKIKLFKNIHGTIIATVIMALGLYWLSDLNNLIILLIIGVVLYFAVLLLIKLLKKYMIRGIR
ncbi:flippase [Clostridium baratii]|uniref:flippase n=1 Tax=Clostridium baratii TaxID=1561 RepID=UPI0030D052AC